MNRTEVEVENAEIGVRFICGGCRGRINYLQDICRTCEAIILWTEYDYQHNAEQTEPAE